MSKTRDYYNSEKVRLSALIKEGFFGLDETGNGFSKAKLILLFFNKKARLQIFMSLSALRHYLISLLIKLIGGLGGNQLGTLYLLRLPVSIT